MNNKRRSFERIKHHYEVEKKLADKLHNSGREERGTLYTSLYDELFRLVPDHPLLLMKTNSFIREKQVKKSLNLINRLLKPEAVFLEIGPGDCALSIEAAKRVKKVYAVDVSKELTKFTTLPDNLFVLLSDGVKIDLPTDSVDVAYSNQLMEHLHPEDAKAQLKQIYRVLKPGGAYFCITPNRFTGPHDVSRCFDNIATGFHLKEYTNMELSALFKKVGFRYLRGFIGKQGIYFPFPLRAKIHCEKIIDKLPLKTKSLFVRSLPFRLLLRIIIVGIK